MAKKRQVLIDVVIDDKGTTKKVAVDADKLGAALDDVGRSAKTTEKNTKGLAQTASAGGKNFANMARGITGGLVPAYATLAANIFAISAAFNFLKRAADTADLRESQVQFAQSTGTALSSMTERLREASNGMLGFKEAASAAAIGVAKGFSSEQLEDMAVSATKVSKALGRDFEDSFDRLVRGVSKAEPELLDELGITLRLETATKNYAESIGKSVGALTAAERSQAVLVETQRQLNEQYADFEGKANPFVKLAKVFEDIVQTVTEFFLPAFTKIAELISENAVVALAFFGTLAAGILKSMPFMEGLSESFDQFIEKQDTGLDEAKQDLEDYREEIQATKKALIDAKQATDSDYSTAKGKASTEVQDLTARKGSGLERLQQGKDISERQRKAMLVSARKAQGEYAKLDKKRRKILIKELEKMGKASKEQSNIMVRGYRQASLNVKLMLSPMKKLVVLEKRIGVMGAWAFKKVAQGAKMAGKAMNAMMKATVILGVVQMVYDALHSLMTAPYTIMTSLIDAVGLALTAFQLLFNKIGEGFVKIKNKITGGNEEFEKFTFAEDTTKGLKDALDATDFGKWAKGWEENNDAVEEFNDRLDNLKSSARDVADELSDIIKGIKEEEDATKRGMMTATGISTAGIAGQIGVAIKSAGKLDENASIEEKAAHKLRVQQAFDTVKQELAKEASELSPLYARAFGMSPEDALKEAERIRNLAGGYLGNVNAVKEGLRTLSQNISGGDLLGAKYLVDPINESAKALQDQAKKLGISSDQMDKLTESFKGFNEKGEEGAQGFLREIEGILTAETNLAEQRKQLELNTAAGTQLTGTAKEQYDLVLAAEAKKLEVATNTLELDKKKLDLKMVENNLTKGDKENREQSIEALTREIAELERKGEVLEANANVAASKMTDIDQIGEVLGTSLQTQMSGAFEAIATGAKSAKDAFKDMAKSILASLVQIITKLMVTKMLTSALGAIGGAGFTDWLGLTGKAQGGIVSNGLDEYRYGGISKIKDYSAGGVARGRDSGYPAMLHGTEAVVPLPNNRHIPVDLKGAGTNQNNVTVNVSVNSDGSATTDSSVADSEMAGNLGNMVAKAVQDELHFQKRSGGILNPYGAA